MKLSKSLKVRDQIIPAGTVLEFSVEGYAEFNGLKIAKTAIPEAAIESVSQHRDQGSKQKLAKSIRLGEKVIPAGTELTFSNEGFADFNGEQISIYQIPTAAFESYTEVMAAVEADQQYAGAHNVVDQEGQIKSFDALEPGDLGADKLGQPIRILGKGVGKAGFDALVNQFGNLGSSFEELTAGKDDDELSEIKFVAYTIDDGSVFVDIYGVDYATACEAAAAEILDFADVQSGDDAVDWDDKPCVIVAKGIGETWYKKILDAIKCPDCMKDIREALGKAEEDPMNDVEFVLVTNDKNEKNLSHYGQGGVKVYKQAE